MLIWLLHCQVGRRQDVDAKGGNGGNGGNVGNGGIVVYEPVVGTVLGAGEHILYRGA